MNQRRIKKKFISTATPQEIVFDLLDKLVVNLHRADLALSLSKFEESNNMLIDSQNILLELAGMMQGKDADSIQTAVMFEFWAEQLMIANMNKNRAIVKEVYSLAKRLKTVYGGYLGREGIPIRKN